MLLFTFDQLQLNPLSQSIALFKMPKQESNCHPVKILRKSGPSKKVFNREETNTFWNFGTDTLHLTVCVKMVMDI